MYSVSDEDSKLGLSKQSSVLKIRRQSILGQIGTPSNLNMMQSNIGFNRPSGANFGLNTSLSLQKLPGGGGGLQVSKLSAVEEAFTLSKIQPMKLATGIT
jgi:hypothetical protein